MVSRRRAGGFTLTELLVVVVVVATLGAMAGPSFSQMIAGQRVKGAASDLFAALVRTRSEAIKRNTEVTLAPAAAGWQAGWVIPNPADSGNKIDQHGAVPNIVLSGPASVVYLANGRLKNATAPTIQVSASGTTQVRCIGIDLSGRPFQKSSAC